MILDYDERYDELGDLCKAFSDMKDELKDSLSKQWQLEQDRVEMVSSLAHDFKISTVYYKNLFCKVNIG